MLAATKEMKKTCEALNQAYVTNIHNSKEKVKQLIITYNRDSRSLETVQSHPNLHTKLKLTFGGDLFNQLLKLFQFIST